MANKQDIQEMLKEMGFEQNYIQKAFQVYEDFTQKNYGHSYNVEVITEITIRLQNEDKTKRKKITIRLQNVKKITIRLQNEDKTKRKNKKNHLSSSNKLSKYQPAAKQDSSPSHTFKKGDIVFYVNVHAEVMAMGMGNLVEISYPASKKSTNRTRKTVHIMDIEHVPKSWRPQSAFSVSTEQRRRNQSHNQDRSRSAAGYRIVHRRVPRAISARSQFGYLYDPGIDYYHRHHHGHYHEHHDYHDHHDYHCGDHGGDHGGHHDCGGHGHD